MKHSIVLKFIAVLLAVSAFTLALACGFGVFLVGEAGLYETDYEIWYKERCQVQAQSVATGVLESYVARTYSGLSREELNCLGWGNDWATIGLWNDIGPDQWRYTISLNGSVQETNYEKTFEAKNQFTFSQSVNYPKKTTGDTGNCGIYWVETEQGEQKALYIADAMSPEYTVSVWFAPDVAGRYWVASMQLYELLAKIRYQMIIGLGVGLLLLAVCAVYLCCVVGRKRAEDEPKPGGLNRLPVDFYAACTVFVYAVGWPLVVQIVEVFLLDANGIGWGWFALGTLAVFMLVLCAVGLLLAVVAQWKMGIRYLWKHSVIGWTCGKMWVVVRFGFSALCKLLELIPVIWHYLLIAGAMWAVPMFCTMCCIASHGIFRAFWLLLLLGSLVTDLLIILYGGYGFGTVLKGARKMASGNLYAKIDTRFLIGAYRSGAKNLNALADVAETAAKNQLKSERMKTELITNVSHDIKTPLTSIINYIDLLQKAEDQNQSEEYLKVLDRQSQRLKKLIEDLIEMSKATTGDMAVDLERIDPVEAINQALGEFADKLTQADLKVVFRQPENPVAICADGRLTWRVLCNLLSNATKYAMPGTRVYVDLQQIDGKTHVSIKNISKEALNISADELKERFVRGDASRNTEGSGLGLNIAQSLMELQKGKLELLVDGDLFKVTLVFPNA